MGMFHIQPPHEKCDDAVEFNGIAEWCIEHNGIQDLRLNILKFEISLRNSIHHPVEFHDISSDGNIVDHPNNFSVHRLHIVLPTICISYTTGWKRIIRQLTHTIRCIRIGATSYKQSTRIGTG